MLYQVSITFSPLAKFSLQPISNEILLEYGPSHLLHSGCDCFLGTMTDQVVVTDPMGLPMQKYLSSGSVFSDVSEAIPLRIYCKIEICIGLQRYVREITSFLKKYKEVWDFLDINAFSCRSLCFVW